MPDLHADDLSFDERSGTSRRTALKLALGAGYAAAAGPLMAQSAITTASDGLEAGTITYLAAGVRVPAYMAKPRGKSNLPVVLVVQEIFGVHAYIADTCRRLARLGYLAIAPDLYLRQGNAREYSDIPKLLAEVVAKVPDAQVMADLDAALDWAGANGGDASRAAVTGFCWGGRITWLYATSGKVKAGVAWYGRMTGTKTELTPRHPVEVAGELKAPVLGLYGAKDAGIPLESVEAMRQALTVAGDAGNAAAKASKIELFAEADHGFHADYRPTYHKAAAEAGWQQLQEWFKANGVAPSAS
ncbi:carboxymethylenebutenolidase [Comamonas serinivorans]|uniref:Carboxymethylenebutenolidase n=1 Tax=Comamonas serinivorans TaxID=1082851 RepID=A0A1Y0EQF2_9BURK|nr:dienelactone hydrolase family protein [Comamonas serinivorans]ARU05738.1 carboxymethylenebutenolidase [Comamonas serinivorans]